ncbi:MAG: hypothetical protein SAK29_30120 [Scytonema sp. PMC 1069.18]|nr:hypothetical protein [Scytonema sp. PMC 1069.18]MEC4884418.1 hypothetical protein [Scytonema sp. PMC 1070.18]
MQEAWLLFDEVALRSAAGNPRGRQPIKIPAIATIEQLSDPKDVLHKLLREASGLTGRKLKQFSVHERVHRVAELIEDFSPLKALPAFQLMDAEIKQVIQEQSW